jgi:MoaA/NifB/PqqE/SkfB family radical SAM enzyme
MTDTLCVLPFIHFNILANGRASVCCVSNDPLLDREGTPLNIRTNSMEEIWNSDALRDVRRQMLAGEKPSQCMGCYKYEKRDGAGSHRTGQNWQFLLNPDEPPTLEADGWARFPKIRREDLSVDMGKPFYFDLRFDNLCNLKCVICFAYASSRIENDDVHRAWTGEEQIERTPNRFDNAQKWVRSTLLFEELRDIGSEVKYIQLAGGEPFMSDLALRWLAHLGETGGAKHVTLKVFTNLNTLNDRIIELLTPFRFIDMTLSIDAVDEVYEYVRYPGKWDVVLKNAKRLVAERDRGKLPQMVVNINATMSAQGGSRIIEVFDFAKEHGFGVTLSNAMDPAHASTKYLPNRTKERLLADLEEYADNNPEFVHMKRHIGQWETELKSVDITEPRHRAAVHSMMRFTNDMDESRGLSYASVQPQVVADFEAEFGPWITEKRFAGPRSDINVPRPPQPPIGRIEGDDLIVGDKSYEIVPRIAGAIEQVKTTTAGYSITGWAVDSASRSPARRLLVAIGDEVVEESEVTQPREDIMGGFGVSLAGFAVDLAKRGNRPTIQEPIRLFAVGADGRAAAISCGDAIEGPMARVPFATPQEPPPPPHAPRSFGRRALALLRGR